MPFFNVKPLHQASMLQRYLYLHYGMGATLANVVADPKSWPDRALAVDVRGGLSDVVDADLLALGAPQWYSQMDDLHARYESMFPKKRGERTAYGFILSPDPEDACTLEQVRDLANAWLDENFPDSTAAVIYHDDSSERIANGEKGILHAHVTVSAVKGTFDTPTDGLRKWHISKDDFKRMRESAQRLAAQMGLSYIDPDEIDRHERIERENSRESLSGPERYIVKEGRYSWKDELREVVKRTVPFCTSLEQLQRSLAPYGFGVQLVDEDSGVLLFTNPEGKKVNSRKLGFDHKEHDLERFYKKVSWRSMNERRYRVFADEVRMKSRALDIDLGAVQDELQRKLDVLGIIRREKICCYDDFNVRKRELNSAAKLAKKDLDLMIEIVHGDKGITGEAVLYEAACDVRKNAQVMQQFVAIEDEGASRAFWHAHRDALQSYDAGMSELEAHGCSLDECESIIDSFRASARDQLEYQAAVEGYSRRIVDLNDAQYIVRQIQQKAIDAENEERAALGMSPRVEVDPDFRKPPKHYKTKNPPVYKVNINKARYQQIKELNRATRQLLARTEPDRKLPPYIKTREQLKASERDQMRRRVEMPKVKHQRFMEVGSEHWMEASARSAREQARKGEQK